MSDQLQMPYNHNDMQRVSCEHCMKKQNVSHVESTGPDGAHLPQMRSQFDDIGIWQAVKSFKFVTFVAISAAFSVSLEGYQLTLNGGIVSNKGFIRQFAPKGTKIIAGSTVSNWGGIQTVGIIIGSMCIYLASDRLGRKYSLYFLWLFLTASIFAESFATISSQWLGAKLLSGVGIGMLQATLPVYLAEIAPTQIRGLLINSYVLWQDIGGLLGSVALNEINKNEPLDFRLAIYTQWAMIGMMIIVFILVPESPWWLVGQGKTEKAGKTLTSLYGHVDDYDVHKQIDIIAATIEQEESYTFFEKLYSVFRGRNFLRLVIAAWPKTVQQLVGYSVFTTYATYLFQYAGFANPFLVTVILGCVKVLAMIFTAALTDKCGRRPLTIYAYAITVVSVLCLGIVGCFDYKTKALSSLLVFFACLATFSTTGAGSVAYAYSAEVPSQKLRAQTAGWANAFANGIALIFNYCTPLMINGAHTKWGLKTGLFFAGTGAVSVVIAWFILPEVSRRTPAEIDEMFEMRVSLRKFKKHVTAVEIAAREVHSEKTVATEA